jgi:hypothetical protein
VAGAAGSTSCVPGPPPEDGSTAIYVAPDGNNGNPGTADLPRRTLAGAFELAASLVNKKPHIYLAPGVYDEAVTLPKGSSDAPLVIEGGYQRAGATWTRSCEATARDLAILTATKTEAGTPVVRAANLVNAVSLSHLTVKTKDQGTKGEPGKTGESLYGVFVQGLGTKLTLDDVAILVGKAGTGGEGTPGAAANAPACDGTTDCADGTTGADGADGLAATAGSFGETGYLAGVGETGKVGGAGKNGAKGGESVGAACAISCPVVEPSQCKTQVPVTGNVSAKTGTCGCGAPTSSPGVGSGSGGTAVALVVGAGASVTTSAGRYVTTGGGDAPDGGSAGPAASATDGAKGADESCIASTGSTCGYDAISATCAALGTTVPVPGGAAGTKGGLAGKSGKGGSGAGGPSFGIVKIGNATVEIKSAPVYAVGPGGKSGSAGPVAKSAEVGPLGKSLSLFLFVVFVVVVVVSVVPSLSPLWMSSCSLLRFPVEFSPRRWPPFPLPC